LLDVSGHMDVVGVVRRRPSMGRSL
jgi:hypothetical protein